MASVNFAASRPRPAFGPFSGFDTSVLCCPEAPRCKRGVLLVNRLQEVEEKAAQNSAYGGSMPFKVPCAACSLHQQKHCVQALGYKKHVAADFGCKIPCHLLWHSTTEAFAFHALCEAFEKARPKVNA